MYFQESPSEAMPTGTSVSLPRRATRSALSANEPSEHATGEAPIATDAEIVQLAQSRETEAQVTTSEPREVISLQEERKGEEPPVSSKGKGKAKAEEEDQEMTVPADAEEGEIEEEFRSTVVVLDGLDADLHIRDYLAAVSGDLHQHLIIGTFNKRYWTH
jgi:hypothetical protein